MNKAFRHLSVVSLLLLPALALAVSLPAFAQEIQNPKNAQGEQFFMISSVDLPKHEIVLMAPTQLTLVVNTTNLSQYVGEKGQKLSEKDLKAGDTVWAIVKAGKGGQTTAVRIREGSMTPADLQKLYLSHPSSVIAPPQGTMQSVAPLSPAPQANVQNYARSSNPAASSTTSGAAATDPHAADVTKTHGHHHGLGTKPHSS